MRFCPKCGTLMRVSKVGDARVLRCPRCGYSEGNEQNPTALLKERIKHSPKEKTLVLSEKREEPLPKVRDVICPRCGNDEAFWWILQTRRADEPPTRFFKCTKCGHVWREYE